MRIFAASSAQEAFHHLEHLALSAGYNLFRGQRRHWPLVPALARLAETEREEATKRLERFIDWSRTTPATRAYVDLGDAAVAIAQHYGIATNLLDWTSDPRVALFFAIDGDKLPDETPIVFAARSQEISTLDGCRIVKIHVPNLWRLEAQCGLFVEVTSSLAASELEAHCQAVTFPYPPTDIFNRNYFYPARKSDLEVRIDQFFLLDAVKKLRPNCYNTFNCSQCIAGIHTRVPFSAELSHRLVKNGRATCHRGRLLEWSHYLRRSLDPT